MGNEVHGQAIETQRRVEEALTGLYPDKCRRYGLCTMWAANVEQDAQEVTLETADLEAIIPVHEARAKSAERQCVTGQAIDLQKDFNPGVCNYALRPKS